jgi:CheY-like chemotaxis protein
VGLYGATVLLAEPEPTACAIYSRHMQDAHMQVVQCDALSNLISQVETLNPDILVINPNPDIGQTIRLMAKLKKQFPSLPIISMGESIRESHLDAIMNAGVSFHLNRQFSRPRDLLVAMEQILV